MNRLLQVSMILAIIFYFICLFSLLRKNKVTLKYILLWLFTGLVMFLIAVFPAILEVPLHLLGIVEFTNGVFALILFFLILIIMFLTIAVSDLGEKQRILAQKMAIYEKRIRELEEREKIS